MITSPPSTSLHIAIFILLREGKGHAAPAPNSSQKLPNSPRAPSIFSAHSWHLLWRFHSSLCRQAKQPAALTFSWVHSHQISACLQRGVDHFGTAAFAIGHATQQSFPVERARSRGQIATSIVRRKYPAPARSKPGNQTPADFFGGLISLRRSSSMRSHLFASSASRALIY